jgi:heat shock protein HslJ
LPEGFSGIAGKTWKLTAVEPPFPDRPPYSRADFADAGAYTLSFDAEAGRVSGKAFPNRYVGPYRVDGESIAVESLAGTLMAALNEPESLREREYYDALESARSWELSGGRLILHTEKDGAARDLVFEEE